MIDMKEDHYVFAQDLTRLRVAHQVLHEIIHGDFKVKDIIKSLSQQIDRAFAKLDLDTSDQ